MDDKPEKTLDEQSIRQLQKHLRESTATWENKKPPSPFAQRCYELQGWAVDALISRIGTYPSRLSERELDEFCAETLLDLSNQLLPNIPFIQERETAIGAAVIRRDEWKDDPTEFEKFLVEKKLFDRGYTFVKQYQNQHDALQNKYRELHSDRDAEEEMRHFDETLLIQILHTSTHEKAKEEFDSLYAGNAETETSTPGAPSTRLSAGSISDHQKMTAPKDKKEPSSLENLITNISNEYRDIVVSLADTIVNESVNNAVIFLKSDVTKKDGVTPEIYTDLLATIDQNAQEKFSLAKKSLSRVEFAAQQKNFHLFKQTLMRLGNQFFEETNTAKDSALPSVKNTLLFGSSIQKLEQNIRELIETSPERQSLFRVQMSNHCLNQLCNELKTRSRLTIDDYNALRSTALADSKKLIEENKEFSTADRYMASEAVSKIMVQALKCAYEKFDEMKNISADARGHG